MKKSNIITINSIRYTANLFPGNRKTLSMKMLTSTEIEVRHPAYMSRKRVLKFVENKRSWIEKKHTLLEEEKSVGAGYGIYEGRILYFKGKQYRVVFNNGEIRINDSSILLPQSYGTDEIENWYRLKSENVVKSFIEKNHTRIPDCTIKVKKQKRIWGSCNSKKRIYINSRISMCPDEVIEYVLWHEISHLHQMNHSRDFYKILESYCPGYKIQKNWFKKNNHFLKI